MGQATTLRFYTEHKEKQSTAPSEYRINDSPRALNPSPNTRHRSLSQSVGNQFTALSQHPNDPIRLTFSAYTLSTATRSNQITLTAADLSRCLHHLRCSKKTTNATYTSHCTVEVFMFMSVSLCLFTPNNHCMSIRQICAEKDKTIGWYGTVCRSRWLSFLSTEGDEGSAIGLRL